MPEWAADRDPLFADPARQTLRAAGLRAAVGGARARASHVHLASRSGVQRILGSDVAAVWLDLVEERYDQIVRAYIYYLNFR